MAFRNKHFQDDQCRASGSRRKEGKNATFRLPLNMCRKSKRIKKKEILKNAGFLPPHVSARDSKYHHGRNQFAAAVDSLKGLNSLIGEMF